MLIICCNSNANNQPVNKNMQPFEIIFRTMPNMPCMGITYIITEKNISIDLDENKNTEAGKFNCTTTRSFQKDLEKTGELIQLGSMDLEGLEALPHEGCEGGVSHSITIKKEGKIKEIYYGGCTKQFDNNTKKIVRYINSQVPGKYKINL